MNEDEINHLKQQQNAYNRRLKVLEWQAVHFGAYTPPYILMEIEETKKNIDSIEMSLHDFGVSIEINSITKILDNEHRLYINENFSTWELDYMSEIVIGPGDFQKTAFFIGISGEICNKLPYEWFEGDVIDIMQRLTEAGVPPGKNLLSLAQSLYNLKPLPMEIDPERPFSSLTSREIHGMSGKIGDFPGQEEIQECIMCMDKKSIAIGNRSDVYLGRPLTEKEIEQYRKEVIDATRRIKELISRKREHLYNKLRLKSSKPGRYWKPPYSDG
jgi:hypothetical protein